MNKHNISSESTSQYSRYSNASDTSRWAEGRDLENKKEFFVQILANEFGDKNWWGCGYGPCPSHLKKSRGCNGQFWNYSASIRFAQVVRQVVRWPVAWPVELVKDISRVFSTPHHKYSISKTSDCEDIYTVYNFCEFLESIMVHFRYRVFFVNTHQLVSELVRQLVKQILKFFQLQKL